MNASTRELCIFISTFTASKSKAETISKKMNLSSVYGFPKFQMFLVRMSSHDCQPLCLWVSPIVIWLAWLSAFESELGWAYWADVPRVYGSEIVLSPGLSQDWLQLSVECNFVSPEADNWLLKLMVVNNSNNSISVDLTHTSHSLVISRTNTDSCLFAFLFTNVFIDWV